MNPSFISKLVDFADSLVYEKTGQHLENVEKDILQQTLKGKKLSAIESPSYENSYVQRFLAPKLWERLSVVAGESVRKKTVLEVLQRLYNQPHPSSVIHKHSSAIKTEVNGHAALNGSVSYCDLLLQEHLSEPEPAEHKNQKVEDCSSDSTSSQNSQTQNFEQTNSTNNKPSFMNFMKPGIPLLLSVGILGSVFVLSWLANWYGVKNQLAGQLPLAQFSYSLALKLNPLSAAAHYNLATTYEDQNNYQLAHAQYQRAMEGGLIEAYNNQARLYILSRNYDAAVSLLRVIPLAQDDTIKADMYKNRGWARLLQGRYDEAKLDLNEAIKLSSQSPAYCLLAQVREGEGDQKGALLEWENCLGLAYQPKTPEEDKWIHLARQRLDAQ